MAAAAAPEAVSSAPPAAVAQQAADREAHRVGDRAPSPDAVLADTAAQKELASAEKRPASAGKASKSAAKKGDVWTPWRDRIRSHKDAVIFITACTDHTSSNPGTNALRCLLSASADGSIRLFDISKAPSVRQRLTLQPPAQEVRTGEVSQPPARQKHPSPHFPSSRPCGAFTAFAYDPATQEGGGKPATIFAGFECGRIGGYDAADGMLAMDLPGHDRPVSILSFTAGSSGDGTNLLSAACDGTVRGWTAQRGEPVCCLFILDFGPRNPVSDFVYLPGDRFVTCGWDGRLRCVDMKMRVCTGQAEVASHVRTLSLCSWERPSDNDEPHWFFLGTEDCYIVCWAFAGAGPAREVMSWRAHHGAVTKLRVAAGKLLSTSEDRTVRIWNPADGNVLDEFYGHTGGILACCLDMSARMIWTGARDHSLRSWDLGEAERRIRERAKMIEMDRESVEYRKFLRANAKTAGKKNKEGRKGAGSPKAKGRAGSRRSTSAKRPK
eukprot:gnl/TRDRNA2_/TRDRNA2_137946_c0_seq1.p1 gnl/TRDRNA2_/TRDRNA2_137946_c0~~gnl/TRDRNA2_/TRDRNA2_137946_c0_seq1.p1  ORF type:complete len:496 (-),score=65.40 gnl/TRDRNA2_/TRDRNA2_137946_c0_seq1:192-1679(-)